MSAAADMRPHVVVVGAGIAGIAAATELRRQGLRVTVLERAEQVGGRAKTVPVDGTRVNIGADFISSFSTELLREAEASGGNVVLIPRRQRTTIVSDGVAWPLSNPFDLLHGELLSASARVRLPLLAVPVLQARRSLDPVELARASQLDDGSADELVRHWAGAEVAARVVGPLVRGLLYWELETTSRVPLLAMLAAARGGGDVRRVAGGMETLVDALAAGLDVQTGAAVTSVREDPQHGCVVVSVEDGAERRTEADAVICATTAPVAAALVEGLHDGARQFLRSVAYSRTAVITCRLPAGTPPPTASALFRTDAVPLLASVNPCWESERSDGPRHIRIHVSDRGCAAWDGLDEEELARRALEEARAAVPHDAVWTARAVPVHVWRWEQALPRFAPGYLRTPALREPRWLDSHRIAFAGDYLLAPHLEGAWRSGRDAAARLAAAFGR